MPQVNPVITNAQDLVTQSGARRSGFIEYALRKNIESIPYIDRAKALKAIIRARCAEPREIVSLLDIRESLLEAAGISVKAKAHLTDEDKTSFLNDFIEKVLVPSGDDFVEEVAFRYLLAAGDALGGKMRNIIGAIATEKLTRCIVSQLQVKNIPFEFSSSKYSSFADGESYSIENVPSIKAIRWSFASGAERHLIYNTTVPQVRKNIDIVLLSRFANLTAQQDIKAFLEDNSNYTCIGELKGGIDPAGADEHWKTANTALGRVRTAFLGSPLHLVFVGAAIETAMASEIYAQYSDGRLSNCANLTSDDQLCAFCDWFTSV